MLNHIKRHVFPLMLVGLMASWWISCLGNNAIPGGEVTQAAGLKLEEAKMHASIHDNILDFSLVLQRTQQKNFEGKTGIRFNPFIWQ